MTWLLALALSTAQASPQDVVDAPSIVWAGIDYSQAQMIAPEEEDFRDLSAIFPGYLRIWNQLFLEEMVDDLSKAVRKPVEVDTTFAYESAPQVRADEVVVRRPGITADITERRLTEADLARVVSRYQVRAESGVGLVFVMESMVKSEEQACLYATFFDIGSHELLAAERLCGPVGGFGFRNYWFRPVKEAVDALRGTVKGWSRQR